MWLDHSTARAPVRARTPEALSAATGIHPGRANEGRGSGLPPHLLAGPRCRGQPLRCILKALPLPLRRVSTRGYEHRTVCGYRIVSQADDRAMVVHGKPPPPHPASAAQRLHARPLATRLAADRPHLPRAVQGDPRSMRSATCARPAKSTAFGSPPGPCERIRHRMPNGLSLCCSDAFVYGAAQITWVRTLTVTVEGFANITCQPNGLLPTSFATTCRSASSGNS